MNVIHIRAADCAGEILLEAGIEEAFHYGLMAQVAPGWKLRVLLAQALFADPDILLLDEPTNNLTQRQLFVVTSSSRKTYLLALT